MVTKREVTGGFVAVLPLLPGNVAWGVAFGAAAAAVGLRPGSAVSMSAVVWSGTVQLAALGTLGQPLVVLFLSSLLLSLRFVPMSLSLAALLPAASRPRRVLAACGLADASFALMAAGRLRSPAAVLGSWLGMYPAWVAGTATGALAAPLLPARLLAASDGLVAVIFAVLAVEACTSCRQVAIASAAVGGVALAMLAVPGAVALPITAVLASGLGLVARR
jgi:predicted branched-subunit amino acid permease